MLDGLWIELFPNRGKQMSGDAVFELIIKAKQLRVDSEKKKLAINEVVNEQNIEDLRILVVGVICTQVLDIVGSDDNDLRASETIEKIVRSYIEKLK